MSREIVLIRRLRSMVLLRRFTSHFCFESFHCRQYVSSLSRFSSFAILDHCYRDIVLPLKLYWQRRYSEKMPSCCEVDGRSNHATPPKVKKHGRCRVDKNRRASTTKPKCSTHIRYETDVNKHTCHSTGCWLRHPPETHCGVGRISSLQLK